MAGCLRCDYFGQQFTVREPYDDTGFDPTMGLRPLENGTFECPTCGKLYTRTVKDATMFHDYREYTFARIDQPASKPNQT
jgi:hypothetical protein